MAAAALAVAVGMSLFQFYTAVTIIYTPFVQRGVHLAFAAALGFLIYPRRAGATGRWASVADLLLAAAGAAVGLYAAASLSEAGVLRVINPTPWDFVMGTACILLLLELTRRAAGSSLALTALGFLLYALLGQYLPGIFGHPGFSYKRVLGFVFLQEGGIFGTALGTAATFIFIFVLFGMFMMRLGGGEFFIDLAQAVFGTFRGASGKVAVFSSALFATITGTGPANVAATGMVTIPLMIRSGYDRTFAAAIEASASVGGNIMPPVLGAAAFIMAELLGVPYSHIVTAALLPGLFYFLALFFLVDLEAARAGLRGLPRAELPRLGPVLRRGWHFLAAIGALIYWLGVEQWSPLRAGSWATVLFLVLYLLRAPLARERVDWRGVVGALETAARSAVVIAAACGVIGVIMGVTDRTGLGLKFSQLMVDLSFGFLPVLLVLSMVASIILGTGLPTTATYLILAVLAAPALVSLGVKPLVAHLFVFYFGVVADLTPPTALSCFIAAGIAGAPGMRTAFLATRLAFVGFLMPFMFVYSPALLLDGTWQQVGLAAATGVIGVWGFAVGLAGYFRGPVPAWGRAAAVAGGLCLIIPGVVTDAVGVTLIAAAVLPRLFGRPALAGAPSGQER
jgi:TRAP transporter 4TM/12TM fusion protein